MRCHDDASTDVVMAIRYRFVSEVQKYRGNVREEDNNDQVMYKNKKKMISLKKGFSLFLNNLMIKEVFIRLLPPLSRLLPTKVWGYVPRGTKIRV